jgi:hypothetical protein
LWLLHRYDPLQPYLPRRQKSIGGEPMNGSDLLAVIIAAPNFVFVPGQFAKAADEKKIVIGYSQRRVAGSDSTERASEDQ